MRTHALNRTSAKGGPFIGTCFQCGKTDLPVEAVSWPCENIANLTKDEALMVAIEGHASGIEAATAGETGTGSTVGESPVRDSADAQTPGDHP